MKLDEKAVDAINIIYIIYVLITLFSIGLRVPYAFIPKITAISSAPAFLSSLYHLMMLLVIGAIIPKKRMLGLVSLILTMVTALFALSTALLALMKGESLEAFLGIGISVCVVIKMFVDYYRGAYE